MMDTNSLTTKKKRLSSLIYKLGLVTFLFGRIPQTYRFWEDNYSEMNLE